MQESLKRFTIAREGKAEIINIYWHKLLTRLFLAATKDKDEQLLNILNKIYAVKKQVREAGIMKYIEKCEKIYEIAFYQWRYMFPSKIRNDDDLELLAQMRMDITFVGNEIRNYDEQPAEEGEDKHAHCTTIT